MTIIRTRLGTNEDGSPHYHIYSDDPTKSLVLTGPIQGEVELPDGSKLNVTDPFIEVPAEQALAVSDAIGKRYENEGHPNLDAGEPFVATPAKLSHTKDGKPNPKFAEAIEAAVPGSEDSSPQGIIDRMTKKG